MGDDEGMVKILRDDDVVRLLQPADAVRWTKEAIDAHYRGELVAPPRVSADLAGGQVVFTVGRLRGSWFGYRSYDTLPGAASDQVVVVHDEESGRLAAVAIGTELGARRVGAIGAVAVDALTPPSADTLALIGTGTQAYAQLWAVSTVRTLREVRIYSRNPERRNVFAARVAPLVAGTCRAVDDARTAVEGAQIVITATNSTSPVIDAAWITPGAHVTVVGPKQQGRAEFGLDLPAAASLLVTDSIDQIDAYNPPNVLAGTPYRDRLLTLGQFRNDPTPRPPDGISVFFSVGLAGTEPHLLYQLSRHMTD